jgi:signal transduction histidine kinase
VKPGVLPRVLVWAEDGGEAHGGEAHGGEEYVKIFFKDNGVGIDKEAHETIFGIFQRVSKNYEGSGIGLAIVKKGVERMNGHVGLVSQPGEGSTFWLQMRKYKTLN